MNKINVECEVIQDLLPLYQDEVCSMASKKLVEEHIEKCKECKKIRNTLMNHIVDEELIREKNDILEIHERKERKKTFVIGTVTAGVLLVPVIVCLLCNIIIGHALDWFFIVLASLMMIASFTVVPLVVEYRRGTKTIICFTLSLLLLLLTCCVYSNGDWFVVAASGCILGLSILFAPYVINNITLPGMLKNKKGLVVMSWDTLCLYTLIVACGLFCKGDTTYWRLGLAITFYGLLLPWGIFLVIRYIRDSILIKIGLVVIIIGAFFAFINDAIGILSGVFVGSSICFVDLSKGFYTKNTEILNANILMLILLLSLCVGGLLIFVGIIKKRKNIKL